MGINHLELTPELIAVLYPESLIDSYVTAPVTKNVRKSESVAEISTRYPFLGENSRSICFLANCQEHDFLPAEQLLFLQKMLAACKYDLNDIALLNIARIPFDLAELRLQLNPKIIFLWGILPITVGLKSGLPDFNVTMVDGISVVPVSGPDLMSGDSAASTELKQRLWICLKKLFTL